MPIQLTSPWAPWPHADAGSVPASVTYAEAQVYKITWTDAPSLLAWVEFGETVNDEWVPGAYSPAKLRVELTGEDFTTLASALTNEGEGIYDAMKRIVYTYLQTNNLMLAGTIV